jgi:Inner membrane component of T3SS, cytoplasmic domain/YscD/CdsD-like Bon-like domain 3
MSATGLLSSLTGWFSAGSSPSTFVLDCTAGFHQGVRLELEPGDVRIGSTSDADIVLRDAGIAAEHAILRVGPRSIDLHAVGGDVRVGEEIVASGYGCALRAPIDLMIGEARLRISAERIQAAAPTPVEAGKAPVRRRIPTAILIAGALLFVPALGLAAMRPAAPKAKEVTSVASFNVADGDEHISQLQRAETSGEEALSVRAASRLMAGLPATDRQYIEHCLSSRPGISVREAIAELNGCDRPSSSTTGTVPALSAEDAGRKLTEHLVASGLSGLRVSTGGGQVVVAGNITKQQTDAWTETQQWFDASYRGLLVLVAKVTLTDAKKPAPVVNVQAVWFGERPYIITAEGNRYYKGAYLDNGWTIKDIADGRILLAKDGETLALVYRQ